MNSKLISNLFIASAMVNIGGVLLFSKCFTNPVIPQTDPVVMSNFGLLMIMVWGLAYLSVAKSYEKVPLLTAVFSVEKLAYVVAWVYWHANNELAAVFEQDLFAGIFYTIYGLNDLFYMCFFAWVFIKTRNIN